jgi:integrase
MSASEAACCFDRYLKRCQVAQSRRACGARVIQRLASEPLQSLSVETWCTTARSGPCDFKRRKGSRAHPGRHDLKRFLFEYIDAAGLRDSPKGTPIFLTTVRKEKRLTDRAMHVNHLCRMVKRRMKDAGLPSSLSACSFRVTVITDLLTQGVDLADVQGFAGHADPREPRACTTDATNSLPQPGREDFE